MAANITSAIGAGSGAGFDISAVIAQLVQIERQPINVLETRSARVNREITALNSVKNKLSSLQTAANGISEASGTDLWSASSSNADVATASAGAGATSGSMTFQVTRLASQHTLRSRLTASSTTTAGGATSADRLAVIAGLGRTGIGSVRAGGTLGTGALAVAVEQASQGAAVTGTAIATTTTIDATNNSFTLDIGGSSHAVTIANGTYDRAGLLSALQTAISASTASNKVEATLDAQNRLVLTTADEGSAATLQVMGGNALTAMGHSIAASATTGVDGIISVRGNSTTISNVKAGATATLSAGNGETLDVTLSGGLRVGSATGSVVSLSSGSLSDVVSAINTANVGVKAQTIQVGASQFRLQISATTSGKAAGVAVSPDAFDSLGGMVVGSQNSDASITIGEGTGAFSVESATNSFDSLMTGWRITAKSASASPVTLTVDRDVKGVVDKVGAMVQAANDAIAEIRKHTAVDATGGGNSGVLSSDATMRSLVTRITSQFTGAGIAGVSISRQGVLTFDATKFQTAYEADPSAVTAKLSRGFETAVAGVSYSGASSTTKAGTYQVSITSEATKATSSVAFVGGAQQAETIQITRGSNTASYTTSVGESVESIRLGLLSALEQKGMPLTVETSGGGVRVLANQWGSGGSFSVRWSTNGTAESASGLDVVGTIDGKTASGTGRFLSLPLDTVSGAAGLRVEATGTAGTSVSVKYKTGLVGGIAYSLQSVLQSSTGTLALAESSRKSRITGFNNQIDAMERRVAAKELSLKRQYSSLDSLLGQLKGQQTSIANQLNNLNKKD